MSYKDFMPDMDNGYPDQILFEQEITSTIDNALDACIDWHNPNASLNFPKNDLCAKIKKFVMECPLLSISLFIDKMSLKERLKKELTLAMNIQARYKRIDKKSRAALYEAIIDCLYI